MGEMCQAKRSVKARRSRYIRTESTSFFRICVKGLGHTHPRTIEARETIFVIVAESEGFPSRGRIAREPIRTVIGCLSTIITEDSQRVVGTTHSSRTAE